MAGSWIVASAQRVAAVSIGGALVVAAGCSTAPTSPDERADIGATSQAIQHGQEDTTHTFALGLCGGNRGSCSGICSASLITPNLVVTARHCVSQSPTIIDCSANPPLRFGGTKHAGNFWVTTHHQMLGQNTIGWHRVTKIVFPDDDRICGNDLALLYLDDLVNASEATPIIPGIQYAMGDKRYTHEFTAIGYGNTSPAGGTAGTRRIRQKLRVRCIPGDTRLPCPPQVNPNEFVGSDGVCKGDSGSSAYEQSSFNTGNGSQSVSFGVLSRGGDSNDGTACLTSIYTRLDTFRDLVLAAAEEASESWTAYPKPVPDWTVYVPPPPPEEDAGAAPALLEDGEACATNDDCVSGQCATNDDGTMLCAAWCDEAEVPSGCADGYTCQGTACLPVPAAPPTAAPEPEAPATGTRTVTKGCAAAPGGAAESAGTALLGLGLAAALLGARRRRTQS